MTQEQCLLDALHHRRQIALWDLALRQANTLGNAERAAVLEQIAGEIRAEARRLSKQEQ